VRVDAAHEDKQQANTQQKALNHADFVGSETCVACHDEISKKFTENPHSRLAMLHGGKGVTCEACHGSGKEHVEGGGDVEKIFRFGKASAKAVDDKCLECHAGNHPNFERSAHGDAKVSCVGCHSSTHIRERSRPSQDFAAEALLHLPRGYQACIRAAISSQSG
jgi:hypothetical protein